MRKLWGTFCLYTESFRRPFFFFSNNRNILVLKCEYTQPPKIVVKLLETPNILAVYPSTLDSSSNLMYWSVIEKYYFTYFVSLQHVSSFAVFFALICSPLCASASVVSC